MTDTKTLTETCEELLAGYPEAFTRVSHDGTLRAAVLMSAGDDLRFWDLAWHGYEDPPFFTLAPRGSGSDGAYIERDGEAAPGWAADAITGSFPLPADGSLFGWQEGGAVTALVPFYASPDMPEPRWTLCPRAGMSGGLPPFTGRRLLGPWFWEHLRAGRLVDLCPLIGATEGTVFWVDTVASLGSGTTAVARDVGNDGGIVLPRGVYPWHETLQAGIPLPSLDDLLADPSRVDLGPRFPLS